MCTTLYLHAKYVPALKSLNNKAVSFTSIKPVSTYTVLYSALWVPSHFYTSCWTLIVFKDLNIWQFGARRIRNCQMLLKTFKFWSTGILCNTRSRSLLVPRSRAVPAAPGFMGPSWAVLPLAQHCAALWHSLCLGTLQLLGFWGFLLPRINRIKHVPSRADLAPLPYHVCSGGVEFCSWIYTASVAERASARGNASSALAECLPCLGRILPSRSLCFCAEYSKAICGRGADPCPCCLTEGVRVCSVTGPPVMKLQDKSSSPNPLLLQVRVPRWCAQSIKSGLFCHLNIRLSLLLSVSGTLASSYGS